MQSLRRALVLSNTPHNAEVMTQQVREFASKFKRVIKKKKKKPLTNEELMNPPAPPSYPKYAPFHPPELARPITASHLPICNTGLSSILKGKKMAVETLTPLEKKFDTTNLNEERYAYGMGNPNKPHVIFAYPRDVAGRTMAAKIRSKGFIPCCLTHMADTSKNLNIYLDPLAVERLTRAPGTYAAIHHIEVEGYSERIRCLVRNWAVDTATRRTTHVQFVIIEPNRKWLAKVPVHFFGESESMALKQGGVLLQPSRYMYGYHDPALGARVGHCEPPTGMGIDVVDRNISQTFHGYNIPKPFFYDMPKNSAWERHVYLTFTKRLG